MHWDLKVAHPKHGRSFGMRMKGGADNSGYILIMHSGLSLVASYSSPHFLVLFWSLKIFGIVFLLCEYKLEFSMRLSI